MPRRISKMRFVDNMWERADVIILWFDLRYMKPKRDHKLSYYVTMHEQRYITPLKSGLLRWWTTQIIKSNTSTNLMNLVVRKILLVCGKLVNTNFTNLQHSSAKTIHHRIVYSKVRQNKKEPSRGPLPTTAFSVSDVYFVGLFWE